MMMISKNLNRKLNIKLILSVLLVAVLVCSTAAFAEDKLYYEGDFAYEIEADGTISIVKYVGSSVVAQIPYTIGMNEVKRVSEDAFVGTSVSYVQIPDTFDFTFGPDLPNDSYSLVEESVKEAGTITAAPSVKDNLVYNGEPQQLIVAGNSVDGTIKYALGNPSGFNPQIPTAENPGTYAVYYYLDGDENHTDSEIKTLYATIAKADIDVTANNQSYIFDEDWHGEGIAAESECGSEIKVRYSTSIAGPFSDEPPKRIYVGTYTVYYEASAENHNTKKGSYTLTIAKADFEGPLLSVSPFAKDLAYDGSLKELIIPGFSEGRRILYRIKGSGDFSYDIPKAKDAGDYIIEYYVEGDENHNDGEIETVNAKIKPASITVSAPDADFIYNGHFKTNKIAVTTVNSHAFQIKYKTTASGEYNLSSQPVFKDAGEHTVYYQITAENHKNYEGSYIIDIAKAPSTFSKTPKSKDLIYTGSLQALLNAGESPCGQALYRLENGEYSENVPSAKGVGKYTVYYYIKADSNHYDSDPVSIEVSIAKAKITVKAQEQHYVHDNKDHGNGIECQTVDGHNAVVLYGTREGVYNLSSAPMFKDVGTHTVYYKVSAENHEDCAGYYKVIISSPSKSAAFKDGMNPTYTIPSARELVYNGEKQQLLNDGTTDIGSFEYKLGFGLFSKSIPSAKNVGEYSVQYRLRNGLFNVAAEGEIKVEILPAQIEVFAPDQRFENDGKAHGDTVTATTVDGSRAKVLYSLSGLDFDLKDRPQLTDEGVYTVYFKASAENHKDAFGSYTITITKALADSVDGKMSDEKSSNLASDGETVVSRNVSANGETVFESVEIITDDKDFDDGKSGVIALIFGISAVVICGGVFLFKRRH